MRLALRFGVSSSTLNLPDDHVSGHFAGPVAGTIDVSALTRKALSTPIESPPLGQGLTPEDQVTIVLDEDLPTAGLVLDPLLDVLEERGVDLGRVILLMNTSDDGALDELRASLKESHRSATVARHDPLDKDNIAYLATSADGRRIYLDRRVTDADAIITVGRIGFDSMIGVRGTSSDIFPALSDEEAIGRSRRLAFDSFIGDQSLRQRQISDEVGWLVGLFFSLAVTLDRTGAINAVWFGEAKSVLDAGRKALDGHWRQSAPRETPDLGLAVLAPCSKANDWLELASGWRNLARLVEPGTPLVAITDLEEPPGPACRRMIANDSMQEDVDIARHWREPDSLAAAWISACRREHRLYLHSRLAAETVESMGMVPVASMEQIESLFSKHARGFVLESANRVGVDLPRAHYPA